MQEHRWTKRGATTLSQELRELILLETPILAFCEHAMGDEHAQDAPQGVRSHVGCHCELLGRPWLTRHKISNPEFSGRVQRGRDPGAEHYRAHASDRDS
jgi:hypothetical protein